MGWYVTGSEALAAYAVPRQTMDLDLVVATDDRSLAGLARTLEPRYLFAEPIRSGNRSMASLVSRAGADKVDLIVRDPDPWGGAAMDRRERWEHPDHGQVWVASLEDLILAKLEWSEGTSELQLRDCAMLVRMN